MNTPAHLIMGAAAFGRSNARGRTWAAIAGAFAPDVSLYLMGGISLFVLGIPAERVFGTLYYSDTWQTVFAIDNSFILWGVGLAFAIWAKTGWAIAFTGAGLLHLAFDFPLHSHDARMHFWPLTDWKFHSPISYWEGRSGEIWGAIETAVTLALTIYLVVRYSSIGWRIVFCLIAAAQIAPFVLWRLMF